jgi:hypothetical protein
LGVGVDPFVAAVTCDIQGSSRYPSQDRRVVHQALESGFLLVASRYPQAVHAPSAFKVVQGDEFQFVLSDPARAYEILVFYRAVAAMTEVKPALSFRASIGVGTLSVSQGQSPYAMDGEAFHRSREGLELFNRNRSRKPGAPRRHTRIRTGRTEDDGFFDLVLMYQDMLEASWTLAQWEAVRWILELETYEQIAARIGIKYQNVQKRLRAANWRQFHRGMQALEARLRNTPIRG